MALTKLLVSGVEYDIGYDGPQTYEGRSLDSYSWEEIKQMCKDADFSEIKVGDYKTFKFGGTEDVVAEVAGIDCYYNTGGSENHGHFATTNLVPIPHHIDFISRDCVQGTYKWNLDNHNYGDSDGAADDGTDVPYLTSYIKKTILEEQFWDKIPTDLQNVIIPKVNILERKAKQPTTQLNDVTGWHWYDMGKLWLPSEFEVFGTNIWSKQGYGSTQAMQYPIFANSWKHRMKKLGSTGGRCSWWLCSVSSGSSTYCCGVDNNGYANNHGASDSYGVPVCLCDAAQNKL